MINYAVRIESRMIREDDFPYSREEMTSPEKVASYCKVLQDFDIEKFIVLFLDNRNNVNCIQVTPGTLDRAVAWPREICKHALLSAARSVVLVHNHPSGYEVFSEEDKKLTRKIKEACDLMGIQLLDHILIHGDKYTSITISADKTPELIARDIQRRVIAEYIPEMEKVRERISAHEDYEKTKKAKMERIARALATHVHENGSIYPCMKEIYCVSPCGADTVQFTVKFEVNCTELQAMEIFEILMDTPTFGPKSDRRGRRYEENQNTTTESGL